MAKASETTVPADFDEADSLFGTEGGATGAEDNFADADDLLNSVVEDDAEGWNPTEKGEFVAGVITKVGQTRSDYAKDNEDPMCPTITVQTREGDKIRVIGFASVLKREMADANLQVGMIVAVKFWGEKTARTGRFAGKPYKNYSIAAKWPAGHKPS